jgi:predicted small integral membrane protein
MSLEWMAWTKVTAGFFIAIGVMLAGMAVWEIKSPTVERKGLLPIRTTRGDRLFIGLLLSGYAMLAWIGLTDLSMWMLIPVVLILIASVIRFG